MEKMKKKNMEFCFTFFFFSCGQPNFPQRKSGGERDPLILVRKRPQWGVLLAGEPPDEVQHHQHGQLEGEDKMPLR
ncbi:hypothetical protein CK203_082607 [Vitis vinifera]|uniref:Uncharacterized protein n=1 Tax=Vitis vinifera TaxID=29760 RepID=A0A438CL25_VITVI|nr:hypothetical protein CK203_082607 [Vitis vinifera]